MKRDSLWQLNQDDAFDKQLAKDSMMSPEDKASRLLEVDRMANREIKADIEEGERFDVLEWPTDVPMTPWSGSVFPSEMYFGRR